MCNKNCLQPNNQCNCLAYLPTKGTTVLQFSKNGNAKSAIVHLNENEKDEALCAAEKLAALGSIDTKTADYVREAAEIVHKHLPSTYETLRVLGMQSVPQIIIKGLPRPCPLITTPLNGIVVESDIRPHIGFLAAFFGKALKLAPFAYGTENQGLILRAIAPVVELKDTISSQGCANDLGMHNDNANQIMVHEANFVRDTPFMNPYQAFACIRDRPDIPMETAALDDLLVELEAIYGPDPISVLQWPAYNVRWPDSHSKGGEVAVAGVPVLSADGLGGMHSRYHAANISGMTQEAQAALDKLHRIVAETKSVMSIHAEPGDLLIYSNTRIMHRRRAYEAKFDGYDRYYVRVYLAQASALCGRQIVN